MYMHFPSGYRQEISIIASTRQEGINKLAKTYLRKESMSVKDLIKCLKSEPYLEIPISDKEIWLAIINLTSETTLRVNGFNISDGDITSVETILRIYPDY